MITGVTSCLVSTSKDFKDEIFTTVSQNTTTRSDTLISNERDLTL